MDQRKRVLLVTFGTLGDIYPFIAIAHAMRRRDLDVVIAAPEMHRGSIEREGVAYARLRPHENDIVGALGVDLSGAFRIMLKNPYFIVTHNLLVGANLAAEACGLPTSESRPCAIIRAVGCGPVSDPTGALHPSAQVANGDRV
jgi:UDP:flavonoid glycosyltransferase YjiC (YdhE family)